MHETRTPMPEQPADQDQLFGIGKGAYGQDTIRPLDHSQPNGDTPQHSITEPEKPKPLSEMTSQDMIEVALADRLEPDIHGFLDPRRAAFLKKYHWTPYSELEVTASIGEDQYETPPLVTYILGAKRNGGLSAVRAVLEAVDKARVQSTLDIETLREAQDVRSGQFKAQDARGNTFVRQVLANAVFARNSFNVFEWPHHYLKKTKELQPNPNVDRKILAVFDKLGSLGNDELQHLCDKTLRHQQARAAFWSQQAVAVKEHSDTQDMVTAARTNA